MFGKSTVFIAQPALSVQIQESKRTLVSLLLTLTYFTYSSNVSIVDFEQVNVCQFRYETNAIPLTRFYHFKCIGWLNCLSNRGTLYRDTFETIKSS